jgi:hypothetical protein
MPSVQVERISAPRTASRALSTAHLDIEAARHLLCEGFAICRGRL